MCNVGTACGDRHLFFTLEVLKCREQIRLEVRAFSPTDSKRSSHFTAISHSTCLENLKLVFLSQEIQEHLILFVILISASSLGPWALASVFGPDCSFMCACISSIIITHRRSKKLCNSPVLLFWKRVEVEATVGLAVPTTTMDAAVIHHRFYF